ncbi:DUF4419 domain-containing protein [Lentzea sp. CA-135723]|uniref:DUF4419 domain-containing protein n=1 Tax=Lentzea sp. CA-135723 TaxID=3239950 RepID=UPI003D8C86D8
MTSHRRPADPPGRRPVPRSTRDRWPGAGRPAQRRAPAAARRPKAFAEHRPLVLSPDAVWLTITRGIAQRVRRRPRHRPEPHH